MIERASRPSVRKYAGMPRSSSSNPCTLPCPKVAFLQIAHYFVEYLSFYKFFITMFVSFQNRLGDSFPSGP